MTNNQFIRNILEKVAQVQRSKNCFRFGAVQIETDQDSPIKGVEFDEVIKVSIFDSETGDEVAFSVKAKDVLIIRGQE